MGELGPVHFIHLGGELRWQHYRAISTARVHGPVVVWSVDGLQMAQHPEISEVRPLELPDWLRDHPIQLANVKDYYAWTILLEYGGIYLDMDTISLRPAWDLLGDADICVSREYPEWDDHPHPFNSAAVVARRQSGVLSWLLARSREMLDAGESRWGAIGPHLLTDAVEALPDAFSIAPYRALSGWSYHTIGDYYANPRDPGGEVRVIHLYSSDHPEWLEDTWMP